MLVSNNCIIVAEALIIYSIIVMHNMLNMLFKCVINLQRNNIKTLLLVNKQPNLIILPDIVFKVNKNVKYSCWSQNGLINH